MAIFLRVLSPQIYGKPQSRPAHQPNQKIQRMKAGKGILESRWKNPEQCQQFLGNIRPFRQPPCFSKICGNKPKNHIGQIQNQQLSCFIRHASRPSHIFIIKFSKPKSGELSIINLSILIFSFCHNMLAKTPPILIP